MVGGYQNWRDSYLQHLWTMSDCLVGLSLSNLANKELGLCEHARQEVWAARTKDVGQLKKRHRTFKSKMRGLAVKSRMLSIAVVQKTQGRSVEKKTWSSEVKDMRQSSPRRKTYQSSPRCGTEDKPSSQVKNMGESSLRCGAEEKWKTMTRWVSIFGSYVRFLLSSCNSHISHTHTHTHTVPKMPQTSTFYVLLS